MKKLFNTFVLFTCVLFSNAFYAANWTWVGTTSNNWDTKSNWNTTSGSSRPQNGDNVYIYSGASNQPTLVSNRTVNNLYLYGGVLDIRTNNLTVNSTTYLYGGSITNSQTGSSGDMLVTDVELDAPAGTTIISPTATVRFRVYGNFNFVNGVFYTSSDDILRFENNATTSGYSAASYTDGPIQKNGNDPFTYPVGKAGVYAPIAMSTPSTNTNFVAEYFPTPYSNTSSLAAGVNHISNVEYWVFDRISGSANVNVTLSYTTARSGIISNQSNLIVARWNGSQWVSHGNGGTTGSKSNGTVVSSAAITSFSPFTIGSTNTLNPLPVNLISFNAELINSIVNIKWTTVNELNNDYFTIEKSTDGINWFTLSKIKSNGNSDQILNYSSFDNNPVNGIQFYRLSQTDLNGNTVVFNSVSINYNSDKISKVTLFPNPAHLTLNVDLGNEDNQNTAIKLYNSFGQVVYSISEVFENSIALNIEHLPEGIYTLEVNQNSNISIQKFLKK